MRSSDPAGEASEVDPLAEPRRFSDLVENAMKRAVKEAIAAHHRAGTRSPSGRTGRWSCGIRTGHSVPFRLRLPTAITRAERQRDNPRRLPGRLLPRTRG